MVGFLVGLLNILLVLSSVFLICLVLIQRGKGGGLAGAFGGPGGSSAFGTKAGDVFTRITIITAGIWIAMAMIQVILINRGGTTSAFQGSSAPISDLPFSEEVPAAGAPGEGAASDKAGGTGAGKALDATTPAGSLPSPEKGVEGLPSAIGKPEAEAPPETPAGDPGAAPAPAEAPK